MPDKLLITSSNQLDDNGKRIITDGIDLSEFEKNPLMLMKHDSSKIIGAWSDLEVKGAALYGIPVFNDVLPLHEKEEILKTHKPACAVFVKALSEAPEDKLFNQEGFTITQCKLIEISFVPKRP